MCVWLHGQASDESVPFFFVVGAGVAQFLLTQVNLLQRTPLCTHATARHA